MKKRSEVFANLEVGQNEIVIRVVEHVEGGDRVLRGEGRAEVKKPMINGIVVDTCSMKQAIMQSLAEAQQNGRVSIRQVCLVDNGEIDMKQISRIIRDIPFVNVRARE